MLFGLRFGVESADDGAFAIAVASHPRPAGFVRSILSTCALMRLLSTMPTSVAAMAPKACEKAMNCGIAVIGTFMAIG